MDADRSETVDLENWMTYLEQEHNKREEKKQGNGDKWIRTLLHTLKSNCMTHDELSSRKVYMIELMDRAEDAFGLLANRDLGDEDAMRKEELLAAYPEA